MEVTNHAAESSENVISDCASLALAVVLVDEVPRSLKIRWKYRLAFIDASLGAHQSEVCLLARSREESDNTRLAL